MEAEGDWAGSAPNCLPARTGVVDANVFYRLEVNNPFRLKTTFCAIILGHVRPEFIADVALQHHHAQFLTIGRKGCWLRHKLGDKHLFSLGSQTTSSFDEFAFLSADAANIDRGNVDISHAHLGSAWEQHRCSGTYNFGNHASYRGSHHLLPHRSSHCPIANVR
jgi:hypothetical protein